MKYDKTYNCLHPVFLHHGQKSCWHAFCRHPDCGFPALRQQPDLRPSVAKLNRARSCGGAKVIKQLAVTVYPEANLTAAVEALHALGIAQSSLDCYNLMLAGDFLQFQLGWCSPFFGLVLEINFIANGDCILVRHYAKMVLTRLEFQAPSQP